MTILIGIVGKIGAGKDTFADHLFWQHGFVKIAFADALRKAAEAMFGVPVSKMMDREAKEKVDPYWGMSPRRMLQLLGTEASKPVFGDDIWLKRWAMTYDLVAETNHVVVPDVRFEVEAAALRERGAIIVHIERPGAGAAGEVGAHVSEAGVAFKDGDLLIKNDGNIADLFDKIDALMVKLNAR